MNYIEKLDAWIPHQLSEDNKIMRLTIASSLITRNRNDPFIDRIVTCDETLVDYDNSTPSGQWVVRCKSGGTIPKKNLTSKKVLMTVWWAARGIIHIEYLPRGQTIKSI